MEGLTSRHPRHLVTKTLTLSVSLTIATLIFFTTPVTFAANTSSGLITIPTTPITSYAPIQHLEAPISRTPSPAVFGTPTLTPEQIAEARSSEVATAFNKYLDQLQASEVAGTSIDPASDLTTVISSPEFNTLLNSAQSTDDLINLTNNPSTPVPLVAAILLILSLGLTAWAVSYRQAQVDYAIEQARLATEALQAAADEAAKVAAIKAETDAFVLAAVAASNQSSQTVIPLPTPRIPNKLYRTNDYIDPNGKHFPVYAMVNGVWRDIMDTAEVERIFGKDNPNIPQVERGSYSIGWDPGLPDGSRRGGGTTGGAMTFLQLWQMQTEVISLGTLPATPEMYAKGIPGTGHPLGWTFRPAQMYNPNDQTIYTVDETSMGDFYSHLGWLSISWDTPKNKISNLAFDKPTAFTSRTPWTESYNAGALQYQPNRIYENPTPTEFQKYFNEQRALGRAPQDIYQSNPYLIKQLSYVAPAPQPTVTIAAVKPELPPPLPTTYQWNVPFRTGLSKAQQDSITHMLDTRANEGGGLNETDARNYAYAIGETNWKQYLGKKTYEVLKTEIVQTVVNAAKTITSASPTVFKQTATIVNPDPLAPLKIFSTPTPATKDSTPASGQGPDINPFAILDYVPGTGDVSDVYGLYTGRTMFGQKNLTTEQQEMIGMYAMLPIVTAGDARLGKKAMEGGDKALEKVIGKVEQLAGKQVEEDILKASSKIVSKSGKSYLLNAEKASLDVRKFTEYALNPNHPLGKNKALVFESKLGFNLSNYEELISKIKKGIMENKPRIGGVDEYGEYFSVDMVVAGPKGSGVVTTGWMYKTGSDIPLLTTLFVK